MTKEQIAFIRKNFSDMRNIDLAAAAGVSKSSVCRVQRMYHLRKSEAHNTLMGRKAGLASNESRGGVALNITPEVIAKRVETLKKTIRLERARVLFGLEQKTRLKVRKEPRPKRRQRCYLKQHGYIVDEQNNIAYWTESTVRAPIMEKGKRNRQYYKFKPISEKDGN